MSHRLITTLLVLLGAMHPALAPVSAQGQREGIKVHGHWVIDVREPDGTLVSHTAFENALTANGAHHLGFLLSRQSVVASWQLKLSSALAPCDEPVQTCTLGEPGSVGIGGDAPTSSQNLTIRQDGNGMLIEGWVTATRNGSIDRVSTMLSICLNEQLSPAACFATQPSTRMVFSGTELSSPVVVQRRQIIQVSVSLSFS